MSGQRRGASVLRYLLATLIGVVIAAISVLLFVKDRQRSRLRMETSFMLLADDRMHNFLHQVTQNLRTLDYLGIWFRSEIEKGEEADDPHLMMEFQLLAHQLTQRYKDIYLLAWVPRIGPGQRGAFDVLTRARYSETVQRLEQREKEAARTTTGAEIFPVIWVEPAEEFRELLDTDLFSRPEYRRLMEEARDRGETRATGPVPCPEGKGRTFDVWLFTPYYRTPAVPTTVAERRAALTGFLVMSLDVSDMMALSLAELTPAAIDLFLLDDDAPPENRILFQPDDSRIRNPRDIEATMTTTVDRPPLRRKSLDLVGGRHWTMVARPRNEFLQAHSSPAPWISLAGGIVLAIVVGGYLILLIGRTDRIGRLVGERTSQLTREIEERERAQSLLRASEEKYRALAENAQDIIYVADAESRIQYANPFAVRAAGLQLEDLLGQSTTAFTPDLSAEKLQESNRLLAEGHSVQDEYRALIGGREVWLDVIEAPLMNADGLFTGLMGIARDITQRKQLETALQQAKDAAEAATRAKSEFLATMSHEIRTPLNGIVGTIGLLLDSDLSGRQRELAEIARDSAGILLALINDILDFSKMEAGKLSVESTPFDLADVFAEVAALEAAGAARKGLELMVRYPLEAPHRVLGDAGRIRQVLLNLVGNAVKFTEHGYILLGVELEAREAERVRLYITVEDTGSGIAEDLQQRLFERFVQGDSSTTRDHGGTGLGLAISRGLVEMMGGTIGVVSRPGAGATFWFRLTLPLDPNPTPQPPAPALRTAQAERPLRVLVAEDNDINQRVAVLALERLGCRVDVAVNGCAAVKMVALAAYDLVLLDCEMPEMDGFAAAREIRRREAGSGRHLPIVAMTARALQGDRERCLAAGMDDYLSKPVSLDALSAALRRHAGPREEAGREMVLDPRRMRELRRVAGTRQNLELIGERFLASAGALLEKLHAAAAAGDAAGLKSAAHSLKGSCATIGAGTMVPICAALDELGRSGALAAAMATVERLDREFAVVREALATLRRGDSDGEEPAPGDLAQGGES